MARTTLNQVEAALSNIAAAHRQINTYYFGDVFEFAVSGTTVYPAMVCDLQNLTMGRNQINYNFVTFFIDRTRKDESNETEVISDMALVAKDFIAEIKHPDWGFDVDFSAQTQLDVVKEALDDVVAGVRLLFTIRVDYPDDTCRIPFDSNILNRS